MRSYLLILLFFTSVLLNAQTDPQGFFIDDWAPKSIAFSTYSIVSQTTTPATVVVTVDASITENLVSKYIFGHNAHSWAGKYNNDNYFTTGVKNLNPGVIRFPGGSISDSYFWNASNRATCPPDLPTTYSYSDLYAGANDNIGWTLSLNNYYDLLAKTNSKGIICVNYGYARYGTSTDPVAAAAHLAADWVRYDNGRTRFWEIGNENYGKWEVGYEIDQTMNKDSQPKIISGDVYGKHCRVFIDSMRVAAKQVKNDIKIGVVTLGDVSTRTVEKDWNKSLMPHIADKADFLILHAYYTPSAFQTVATILNAAENTKSFKDLVNSDLKTYANHAPLPVALTEWNSRDISFGQKTSVTNGVFATVVLGEALKSGYGQASRWAFLNGWSNGDTHSLFATGAAGEGMTKYAPHPPYFYQYYFQKMFGDKMIKSVISGVDQDSVKAYASTFSSGQSGMVLINKGVNQRTVSIRYKNFIPGARYFYYLLNGETGVVYSRKVFVNGETTTESGGGPLNYATLQPNAVSIVNGEIRMTLPMYGVAFLVVEKDLTTPATPLKCKNVSLSIFPNPTSNDIKITQVGFEKPQIKIIDMKGVVRYENNNVREEELTVNIKNICSKGVYFVTVKEVDATITKTFVVI